ncbi:MAG: hypothetical protein ABIS84_15740 [Arachnia sp.]
MIDALPQVAIIVAICILAFAGFTSQRGGFIIGPTLAGVRRPGRATARSSRPFDVAAAR